MFLKDTDIFENKNSETEDTENQLLKDLVFPGCPLTVGGSSVFVLLFIQQHKLTNVAAQSLFNLLAAHFSPWHKAVTFLSVFFNNKFQPLQHRTAQVCSVCDDLLPFTATSCHQLECTETASLPNEFLVFIIETTLQHRFQGYHKQ
jgi:hypothetical protein